MKKNAKTPPAPMPPIEYVKVLAQCLGIPYASCKIRNEEGVFHAVLPLTSEGDAMIEIGPAPVTDETFLAKALTPPFVGIDKWEMNHWKCRLNMRRPVAVGVEAIADWAATFEAKVILMRHRIKKRESAKLAMQESMRRVCDGQLERNENYGGPTMGGRIGDVSVTAMILNHDHSEDRIVNLDLRAMPVEWADRVLATIFDCEQQRRAADSAEAPQAPQARGAKRGQA